MNTTCPNCQYPDRVHAPSDWDARWLFTRCPACRGAYFWHAKNGKVAKADDFGRRIEEPRRKP